MFKIISDGGCDFTTQEVEQHKIDIVPFYITLDQTNFLKEGVDIAKEDYFNRLKEDKKLHPKTAQPSPQDFIDVIKPYIEDNQDVVVLTISSKLSGTNNSARLAAEMLKNDYPARTVLVIDSLNVSVGQGLILRELIKMRDNGLSINEIEEQINKVIPTAKVYFTLSSLEYLRRGGRVGPTTALIGGLLGLRPVLHIVDGAVDQLDSVRGNKKVLKLIEEGLTVALKDSIDKVNISVGHILKADEIQTLKENIENALNIKITNPIAEVGVTIGTHAGPGAFVVAYCRKYESL
ncbi:MAG: DegV family protein [Erysipelotrichales bacterium]|nr:DegV family protein [Erysipelotrichales bacterium]